MSTDIAELSDMAICSSKGGWEIWFFKEKYTGFSKNNTTQRSVIKTKYRINTGRQLEVSMSLVQLISEATRAWALFHRWFF